MKINIKILTLLIIFQLSGCVPAVVGVATGIVAHQDKSLGDTVDDYTIWTKIKSAYLMNDVNNLFANIDVKVSQGRVLLTGYSDDNEVRIKATGLAWEQKGVVEVINEISVSNMKNENIVKSYSIDTWITAQIKAKLLLEKNVKSVNYTIETLNKTVYLFGIARNIDELDTVNNIASITQHVDHVISHIKLKEQE